MKYQKAKLHIVQHEKHMELCRPGSLAAEDRFRFRILKGHQACHIQQKTCDKPKENTQIMQDHERSQQKTCEYHSSSSFFRFRNCSPSFFLVLVFSTFVTNN